MDFNDQTNEELKALKEAIEDELWRRDKIGKHEVYWIRYSYIEELNRISKDPKAFYLTAEEAPAEAVEYMDALYGVGNYEIYSFGRCIRSRAIRVKEHKYSDTMDTVLNSKWVLDDQ